MIRSQSQNFLSEIGGSRSYREPLPRIVAIVVEEKGEPVEKDPKKRESATRF